MDTEFTPLEKTILKAKGLSEDQVAALTQAGIGSREDLRTVGDAQTLGDLVSGIDPEIAARVMEWAVGHSQNKAAPAPATAGGVVLEAADVVHCVHCGARQPSFERSMSSLPPL